MKKKKLITTGYHIPYNPELKGRARKLRKNMTAAEDKLWQGFLRNFQFTVLRQKPLDNYIVDFYCPKLKLVIEIDGEHHGFDDVRSYDEWRTGVLEGYGIRVIRFKNCDIMNNFEFVCECIEAYLNPRPPLVKGEVVAGNIL